MGFANSLLRTVCRFFRRTQRMFAAQWVPRSSAFLISSLFTRRFSYLANSFHITVSAVGSSFSPGSPEVRGKIYIPNMFASMYVALHTFIDKSKMNHIWVADCVTDVTDGSYMSHMWVNIVTYGSPMNHSMSYGWIIYGSQMSHKCVTHWLHFWIQHFSSSFPNLSIFDSITTLPHLGY